MTTARINLFQLVYTARDRSPDGATYGTKPQALAAQIAAARQCLSYIGSSPETLHDALDNGDIETIKPRDAIETLDDLTDDETVKLAESWSDFRADIYSSSVEVDVYDLTTALTAAGCAATVFTVDDVVDRFKGEDPAGWLRDNRRRIEDILSERGNEAIDDLLMATGDYDAADEDEDEDEDGVLALIYGTPGDDAQAEADDEEAAMRARGVTPESWAESMGEHTVFIFAYGGADVVRIADANAVPYATLDSIRAEPGYSRAVIAEVLRTAEPGVYDVVKIHTRH